MKLKDLMEQYGDYEVSETKGDWYDANHVTLELKKPKPKSVWDLKDEDLYYWIDGLGNVRKEHVWRDESADPMARAVGNVFLTREEALRDVERRKVETLLLKHGGRRWYKFSESNYYIRYQREYGMNIEYLSYTWEQGVIYFDSREELTEAIEEIGEERIRKALFEVR